MTTRITTNIGELKECEIEDPPTQKRRQSTLHPREVNIFFAVFQTREMSSPEDEKTDLGSSRHPDTPYDDIVDPNLLPFTLAEQDVFLKVRAPNCTITSYAENTNS